jgi:uncharacterized RDD family membrane protein YckC
MKISPHPESLFEQSFKHPARHRPANAGATGLPSPLCGASPRAPGGRGRRTRRSGHRQMKWIGIVQMNQQFLRYLLSLALGWSALFSATGQDADPPVERAPDAPNIEAQPVVESSRNRSTRRSLGDVIAIGINAVVKADESAHDVVVVGGSATVDGTVTGDLVVVLGKVRLGPTAVLRRDLVVVGGSLDADPAADVRRDRVVIGVNERIWKHLGWLKWPSQWFDSGLMLAHPLPHQYVWSWAIAGIALLLYLTLAVLFPRQVQASVTALEERPGNALLTGLLAFMLVGPLFLLLAVTVVGLVIVPFAVCALVIAFLFGKVAVYRYAGQQIGAQFGVVALEKPLLALIVGALLFCLLFTVPVLGLLVWGVAAPLGLGAVLLAIFDRSRSQSTAGGAAIPEPPTMADSGVPVEEPGARPPVLLPRAGFWLRLVATVLDLALVGIVVAAMFHRPRWFLLVWVIYHLALWTAKGATIGGIVLGLRIVRLDGLPMNFAVALVRLLGSFFSAAVFGIGFFWAGWSQDKQSWHDKIAGTVVVKTPRSASLL